MKTKIFIESEVCVPVRVIADHDDEDDTIEFYSFEAMGALKGITQQLFDHLPQREENCLMVELRQEFEKNKRDLETGNGD